MDNNKHRKFQIYAHDILLKKIATLGRSRSRSSFINRSIERYLEIVKEHKGDIKLTAKERRWLKKFLDTEYPKRLPSLKIITNDIGKQKSKYIYCEGLAIRLQLNDRVSLYAMLEELGF